MSIKKSRRISLDYLEPEIKTLSKTWALRALVNFGLTKKIPDMCNEDAVCAMLGLDYDDYKMPDRYREININKLDCDIKALYNYSENSILTLKLPKTLKSNMQKLSQFTGLSKDDETLLVFTIILKMNAPLEELFSKLDVKNSGFLLIVLSCVLNIDCDSLKNMLSKKSTLNKTALLTIDRFSRSNLCDKLELISDDFADTMLNLNCNMYDLVKKFVKQCEPSTLSLKNYEHIKEHNNVLVAYLQKCINKNSKGVNILIYGEPGTGKTEYAKAISTNFGITLAEIAFCDEDEEPIEPRQRLKALKLAQTFFSGKESFLMFDEAEDVFTLKDRDSRTKATQENKAWINRVLEQNTIPTFWIANSIWGLDNAVLRRFDLCIEMPMPSKNKRLELIEKECGNLITQKSKQKLSECEYLSPAILSKAATVLKTLDCDDVDSSSKTIELLIKSQVDAQGGYVNFGSESEQIIKDLNYNPKLINCDTSLINIKDGIKKTGFARICLYGPAGTGKSAFGKWLADEIDKPIVLKKASDLISMYVGGTEKNLAKAFEEAKSTNSILIIDEVDSFLQDRRGAVRSWEVSAVNEMLVQMESYKGIFIATTNLMDGLDQASLRRFDLKLKFDYLKSNQAYELFASHCNNFGIKKSKQSVIKKLELLNNLTPGDFAAVARQAGFNPIKNCDDFLKRLEDECAIKEDSNNNAKVGFLR